MADEHTNTESESIAQNDSNMDAASDPKAEVMGALKKEVLNEFERGFKEYIDDLPDLQIESTRHDSNESWSVKINGRFEDPEEVQVYVNGNRLNVYFDISDSDLNFKIAREKKRGPKPIFPLFSLPLEETDPNHWSEESQTQRYAAKNVSHIIVESWFPVESSTNSALEHSIKVRKPHDQWATSSGGDINVPVPGVVITQDQNGTFNVNIEDTGKLFAAAIYCSLCYVIRERYSLTYEADDAPDYELPDGVNYKVDRPVSLNPSKVIDLLEEKKQLFFPWHVLESACASLNAGKNVIFTGPPGCGKSKLALFLAKQAVGQSPLVSTASPAWTTGDLIGRYMPSPDGKGLVFEEGFFLKAVDEGRWLIVDEFNRADIDSCFGELFSVLAGDAVELPFQYRKTDQQEGEDELSKELSNYISILPEDAETVQDTGGKEYRVPERFRLIGTMNDADRSGLNNLSFALMRRFAFIPVEAPNNKIIESEIIDDEIINTTNQLKLNYFSWQVRKSHDHQDRGKSSLDDIEPEVKALFASTESSFGNLVSSRTVGVSAVRDIIRFVGEGLRSSGKKEREVDYRYLQNQEDISLPTSSGTTVDRDKVAEMLSLSYLALALVLEIFPQLESLEQEAYGEEDKLLKAIKHIFTSIHKGGNDKSRTLHMIRIAKNDDDQDKYEDRILESDRTIAEFLFENLKTRLPKLDAGRLRSELVDEGWLS